MSTATAKKSEKKRTAIQTKDAVNAESLKSAYSSGTLARQNREPIDSAPGQVDDPLNLEWRRGWLSCRCGECQTPNLLWEIQQAGFDATLEELETLGEDQRIAVLDWLDTVPTSETEDEAGLAWDAFHDRAPGFLSIKEASDGILRKIQINLAGVEFGESGVESAVAGGESAGVEHPASDFPESVPHETASGEGNSATTGTLAENSAESSPPTPAAIDPADELRIQLANTRLHVEEIEQANARFEELNALVTEREGEVRAAKGLLSEAQSERDKAGRELSQVIADSRTGQKKLFTPAEISAAKGTITTAVGEVPIQPGDVVSSADSASSADSESTPAPTPAQPTEDKLAPLSVLSSKEIKKLVGADAFNAAKDQEDPIGLSDGQLEKLESACESDTVQGFEKWIAADSWWMKKVPGFGEKAIQRVISTLVAYRKLHPQA